VFARTKDRRADRWIQFADLETTTYFVAHGFSGSPVFAGFFRRVIGLASLADPAASTKEAFAVPIEMFLEAFPTLLGERRRTFSITRIIYRTAQCNYTLVAITATALVIGICSFLFGKELDTCIRFFRHDGIAACVDAVRAL
jgi:hypothetical protein